MVHLFAISLLAYMSANIEEINSSVQSLTIYIRRAKTDTPAVIDTNNSNSSLVSLLAENNSDDEPIALPVSLPGSSNAKWSAPVDSTEDEGESKKISSWYWSSYVYNYAGLSAQPRLSHHDLNAGQSVIVQYMFLRIYKTLLNSLMGMGLIAD